jgi:hypothetical protein
VNAGDTFMFEGKDDHLWMIISDPSIDSNNVVVICFITYKPYLDQSCIVEAGEHPFIKHRSLVDYHAGFLASITELQACAELKQKQPISPTFLTRIRESTRGSNLPLECMEILVEQELVE